MYIAGTSGKIRRGGRYGCVDVRLPASVESEDKKWKRPNTRRRKKRQSKRGRRKKNRGGRVIEGEVNVSCLLRSSLSSALRFV